MHNRVNYIERPVEILDKKTKTPRNKVVELVKVHWKHRKGSEWAKEPEDDMRKHYLELFPAEDFEDKV